MEISYAINFYGDIFAGEKGRKKIYIKSPGQAFDSIANPNFPNTPNNIGFTSIGNLNDTLYVGTFNSISGPELWKSTDNGNNWTIVTNYPGYSAISSIHQHQNELWITLVSNNTLKPRVLKSNNGNQFIDVFNIGLPANITGDFGNTEFFNNNIFYSFTGNNSDRDLKLTKTCFNINNQPSSPFLPNDTSICNGNSITINAPNGFSSYHWSDGSTNQSIPIAYPGGVFQCEITNNNYCTNGDNIKVTIDSLPQFFRMQPPPGSFGTLHCPSNPFSIHYNFPLNDRIYDAILTNSTEIIIPPSNSIFSDFINISGYSENANVTLENLIIDSLMSNNQQLLIELIPPSGGPINIINSGQTDGQNFFGTNFKRQATNNPMFGGAPYTGIFKPFMPFESLSPSTPTNGSWKLKITNNGATNDTLKKWSISFSHLDTTLNYLWSSSSNSILPSPGSGSINRIFPSMSSNLNSNVSPVDTSIYTLKIITPQGCFIKDSFKLDIPQLNIIEDDTSICKYFSITLHSNNPVSVWFEQGNPIPLDTAQFYTVSSLMSTKTYYAKIFTPCLLIDSITITANNLPNVTSNASPNDSICNGSQITLTGSGANTYSWSGSVNDGQAFVPTATNTYTVTGTDVNSCTNTATISVTVNTLPNVSSNASPNDSICNGSQITLTGSGANTYSWSGSVNDGQAFVPAASNTYTVTGTDANSCTNTATISITVNPLPTVVASVNNSTICFGNSVIFNSSGANSYVWNDPTIQNGQPYTPTASGSITYTVTGTDVNSCTNTATISITVNSLKYIKGNVKYNLGNNSLANGGIVIAYDSITKDSVSSAIIAGAGDYTITNVPPGHYLILCYPDTSNPLYQNLIPTYYGDDFLWDTATIVNHGCISNSTPIDINMQALVPNGTKPKTSISGRLSEKAGFRSGNRSPGEPISGKDVKIGRVPPNGIIFTDTTDSNGLFHFDSVEVDNIYTYTLYIDMPAYTKDASYSFVLTQGNMNHPRFDSLNYIVDSNTIWIDSTSWLGIGINDLTFNKTNSINISPNPSTSNATINYSITNKSKISLGLYNTMGIKMEEFINKEMNEGKYSYQFNHFNKYPPGIYYIVLIADGKKSIAKLVITK